MNMNIKNVYLLSLGYNPNGGMLLSTILMAPISVTIGAFYP